LDRSLDGVLGVEDLVQLLEGAVLGLWDPEVDDGRLDAAPDGEDDICVPPDLLHGHWPSELVEEISGCDGETGESHSLGAHLEGEDLDRVQSLEGREADGVHGTEDEDEGQASSSSGGVGTSVRTRRDGLCVQGRRDGHAEPSNAAADVGEE